MGKPGVGGHGIAHGERKGLDYILMFSWDSYVAEVWRLERERPGPSGSFTASDAQLDFFPPESEGTPT